MPNITTPSYFNTGETQIPNAVSGNAGRGINADLQAIIDKYEKELLLACLGFTQYTELQTELGKLPFTIGAASTAAQKWIDFVNGSGEYQGIKRILGNYIYCKWLRFQEISVTTTGAGKASVQNHTVTDYNSKYVERWNEFVMWWQEWNPEEGEMSLVRFLTDTDGFTTERFRYFTYENSFGI